LIHGWLSKDTIGFFWNANSGGKSTNNATFNWPYINAATFKLNDNISYSGRPYPWSPNFAWAYGYAAPDKNGDIGIGAFFGGGTSNFNPSIAMGIPSSNGSTKPWNLKVVLRGTNGPADGQWGDYMRVRPVNGTGPGWIESAYTLQGGSLESNVEPRYFVFGYESNNSTTISSPGSATNTTSSVSFEYPHIDSSVSSIASLSKKN
jgi:hypothetical protein